MAFLQMLGLKKKDSLSIRTMLPAIHSFIDIAVKNGPKGSVCFENSTTSSFVTTALPGMKAGQSATFTYSNTVGRFRFAASVTASDDKQATFAMPSRIETIQKFAGSKKRTNVRIDTTTACQWRYAPMGKIPTEWQKGSVSDISRAGASLTMDRELKIGTVVELKVPLKANGDSVDMRGEVRRADKIATSKKHSVGLRFAGLPPETDRAILEFINRRQTDLRNRGLG